MRCSHPFATPPTCANAPARATATRASVGAPQQAVAHLAGLWEGTLHEVGADIGTPLSLVHGGAAEGVGVGQLALIGGVERPAAVQLLEASASTYVALIGPYYDPVAAEDVVTVLEGRIAGDRLYGTYRARPLTGGQTAEGRFVAVRARRAAA